MILWYSCSVQHNLFAHCLLSTTIFAKHLRLSAQPLVLSRLRPPAWAKAPAEPEIGAEMLLLIPKIDRIDRIEYRLPGGVLQETSLGNNIKDRSNASFWGILRLEGAEGRTFMPSCISIQQPGSKSPMNGWSHLKKNRWCLVLERLATPPAPVAARNPKEPVRNSTCSKSLWSDSCRPVVHPLGSEKNVACRSEISWHILTMTHHDIPWLLYYGHLWRSTVRGPLQGLAFGCCLGERLDLRISDFLHPGIPWVTMGYTSMVPAKEPLRYWVPLWLSCIAATFSDHPNRSKPMPIMPYTQRYTEKLDRIWYPLVN